ncbi:AEC family transporter [Adlercreutzia sp. ZJ154]|uniref:AEC family transporter n=1 Tax=Adlercreutzia sp. ZJ154 TaxID=2709790 RepID=UPI001F14AF88|nr:AEC family transporter [Adlercreutzia sp. ZJ154]
MFSMDSGILEIFGNMVTLFAIVGVGYAAKKLNLMNDTFDKSLSKVIINLALPAMILGSVLTAEELPSLENILLTFLLSCASYAVIIVIAYALTAIMRISIGHRGVFKFMLTFGNVGFIGFPVLSAIFGKQALIYAAVFNLPFNFLVFTMGIWFLTQDNNNSQKSNTTWRTFLSPAIASCVIAIICTLLNIHAVPVLGDSLETLGSLTTPAALLIIGSSLANMPVRDLIGGFRLWVASLFRLIVNPLCIWFVFHFFVSDPLLLAVVVVISGMPVATNGTMLCYQYGGDSKTMAQGTFVTTVLAIISIPVLVTALSVLGVVVM